MSGGLVPSKSTVYISNLPFSLTNNDIHKVLEKYGKIVKVTVMKDKKTRRSKGVAFVLFLNKPDAIKCAKELNNQEMFGRVLKSSIAADNGKSSDFIKRKNYPDKTYCYECGESGHLSYKCSKNTLGIREPPPKKIKKRKNTDNDGGKNINGSENFDSDEERESEGEDLETLSAAIAYEQQKIESETSGSHSSVSSRQAFELKKKRFKKSNYLSDEEELSE